MTCVVMQQTGVYRWQLVAPKGHMLVDDLLFSDAYRAELYVKAYISSYPTWTYTLKPRSK